MAELQPGAIFAGHRIEGVAGRGGFGVVYRATHLVLDHVVALKLISSGRGGEESFRERFKSESRIAVSIRHPNVVAVHNAGEEDGLLFVTMDFIEGTDLRGLLNREGRLAPREAVEIIKQVAAALDAAHEKGLVHRDIKPGNVLLDESRGARHVYLTDFGLSKQMDASSGVTATGAFVGTLDYVAPEQIKGDRLDARTDVYALGCVLYELLAGQVPFHGQEEKVAKIYAHLQEQPPELVDAAPEVPPALSEVVWRTMAKDPDARHPSAGDFARAAEAALEGRAPSEPERNVGIGAAAPTQAFDVLAAAAAGAGAADTAEARAAEPRAPQTVEGDPPETAEVPPAEAEATPEATTPGETVAVPPPRRAEPSTQPEAPARTARRSRRPLVLGLLAAAILAGGAYAVLGGGDDPGNGGGGDEETGPVSAGLVAEVAAEPVGVAVGGGTVWVSSREGRSLERLDAATGEPIGRPKGLEGDGEQVSIDFEGDVWVAVGTGDGAPGHVMHYAPNGKLVAKIPAGDEPRGIAIGERYAWAANINSGTVTQIDIAENSVVRDVAVGAGPARAIAGGAKAGGDAAPGGEPTVGIWVSNSGDGTVTRITQQGDATTEVQVGGSPRGIAVGGGFVWVVDQDTNQLVQINPGSGPGTESIERRIPVGDGPRSVAFGFGSVWVTNGGDATVSRVDPQTGNARTIANEDLVGADPEGIAPGEDGIWVTSAAAADGGPGTVHLIEP